MIRMTLYLLITAVFLSGCPEDKTEEAYNHGFEAGVEYQQRVQERRDYFREERRKAGIDEQWYQEMNRQVDESQQRLWELSQE